MENEQAKEDIRLQSCGEETRHSTAPVSRFDTYASDWDKGFVNRPGVYPLSLEQESLWITHQILDEGKCDPYIETSSLQVEGGLDVEIWDRAFGLLFEVHPVFRATFTALDGLPVQYVSNRPAEVAQPNHPACRHGWYFDVTSGEVDYEQALNAYIARPMDLSAGPMLEYAVFRCAAEDYQIVLRAHHIVCDNVTQFIVLDTVTDLYGRLLETGGGIEGLEAVRRDSGRVLARRRRQVNDREARDYWRDKFARTLPSVDIPQDHRHPQAMTGRGGMLMDPLSAQSVKGLKALARAERATPFSVLLAVLQLLLFRLSGARRIAVSTAMDIREPETRREAGYFINSLPVITDFAGYDATFLDVLQAVKSNLKSVSRLRHYPFAEVAKLSGIDRGLPHNPLTRFGSTYTTYKPNRRRAGNCEFSQKLFRSYGSPYELSVVFVDHAGELRAEYNYQEELFEDATVRRMAGQFRRLLEQVLVHPEAPVAGLSLLTADEYRRLVHEWNDTGRPTPETSVHRLFEAQVMKTPESTALIYEEQRLSYAELNARANRVAHELIERGVGPESAVGVCLERSVEMVVGLLGILKAGGCYLPLDPDYPAARLAYMLEDSGTKILLTQRALREVLPLDGRWTVVCLDETEADLSAYPADNPDGEISAGHLAYIIYTSGSTGQPKGVMSTHGGLVNRLAWMQRQYRLDTPDRVLQKTPYTFDVSVWEFFWPLTEGAALVMARPEGHKDPGYLAKTMETAKITTVHFVPSMLTAFLSAEPAVPDCLRQVVCSGEALSRALVERFNDWSPAIELHNLYGPTEASIDVSHCSSVNRRLEQFEGIPIGRPIDNIRLYILDGECKPVPVGVAGELHIGGVGLARGYLRRAGLTAEKFIPDPFGETGGRLYRTGDLVRYRPDGEIEYLGRIDHQVKLRGLRIELGEIEQALLGQAAVKDAVVVARGQDGDRYLAAYVVPEVVSGEHPAVDHDSLRDALKAQLPEYMVPSHFIGLETLPLTASGKVDRKALPAPDLSALGRREYVAPRDAREQALAGIWAEVLKLPVESIGVHDNFFELGGHSLNVAHLISRLQKCGFHTGMRHVFSASTLAELAGTLESTAGEIFEVPANRVPDVCERITPQMLPLVRLSAEEIDSIAAMVPGGMGNIQDIYPLSPLQEGILFHYMMGAGHDPYILSNVLLAQRDDQRRAYLDALQQVVNRHDSLRTAIIWKDRPEAVQVVYRRAELSVEEIHPQAGQDARSLAIQLADSSAEMMDLERGPLLRVKIIPDRSTGREFVLLQFHHLIVDHIGVEVIRSELKAHLTGRSAGLPRPVPYREFVTHAVSPSRTRDAEVYFRRKLGDVTESTAPFNLTDIHGDGSRIAEERAKLPLSLAHRIRILSKRFQTSPATLFHLAWARVLAVCSGREDVVFGTVLSGRLQGVAGSEGMMGLFINSLPVRFRMARLSVSSALNHAREELKELLTYEQASLSLAQRSSGLSAGAPLFSALFNYRHSTFENGVGTGEESGVESVYTRERTNYPFTISIDDLGEAFSVEVQVDDSVSATRVIGYMRTVLNGLVEALENLPEMPLLDIPILPSEERRRELQQWNATTQAFPQGKHIHELFEECAALTPDNIAVVAGDQLLTYAELNNRANRLARYLREERGVRPDIRVGVCLERCSEMIIGILAILKAGGAYVPLDPGYPQTRLLYMLEDAGLKTVLITTNLLSRLPEHEFRAVCLDTDSVQAQLENYSDGNPPRQGLRSDHLAYVIYTSGSTGRSKGVEIHHDGLVNITCDNRQRFLIDPSSRFLHASSMSFDAGSWILWMVLTRSAALILSAPLLTADTFVNTVNDQSITHLMLTPSVLASLNPEAVENLRVVIVGGDVCSQQLADKWSGRVAFYNAYGPTECSICSSVHRVIPGSRVNIGEAVGNIQLYVLDSQDQPVPTGVAGELYIGGVGLARGYLNRPALTAGKFVPDPFSSEPGRRLYRTGDLVRRLPDGKIDFLGRIDQQVKVRGFRVEPGEIENALLGHERVDGAVVVVLKDRQGEKQLAAYVTSSGWGDEDRTDRLRNFLLQQLPEYMVPAIFVFLESIPLTVNGKADLRALPEPDISLQQSAYTAPRTETERILCEIWQDLLGVKQVGVNDNFFLLGGHSLAAARMVALVNRKLSVNIQVRTVFEAPFIRSLAEKVEQMLLLTGVQPAESDQDEHLEEGVF